MTTQLRLALVDPARTTGWLYRAGSGPGYTAHHARSAAGRTRLELAHSRRLTPPRSSRIGPDTPRTAYHQLAAIARRSGADPARLALCLWWTDSLDGYLARPETPGSPGPVQLHQVLAQDNGHAVDLLERPGCPPLWQGTDLATALGWAFTEQHRVPTQLAVAAG